MSIVHTSPRAEEPAFPPPLCVDLDGTLLLTDSLHELLVWLAVRRPWKLPGCLQALFAGKAAFKAAVVRATDGADLPLLWNDELTEALRQERARGRRLILVTATHETLAARYAEAAGFFDAVVATRDGHNLRGAAKAQELVAQFGARGFDYAGDHEADLDVWKQARAAWVVNSSMRFAERVRGLCPTERMFAGRPALSAQTLLRSLRPHQWAKNLLLFVPLFAGHMWGSADAWRGALIAFAAFSLCASGIYLLNDLVDINGDRLHRSKRRRPVASGALAMPVALLLSAGLLAGGLALAWGALPVAASVLQTVYVLTAAGYTFYLKRIALVDVFTLAGLYVLRVMAGGAATDIVVSSWLLAFSMFLFLSLALIKRFSEILVRGREGRLSGRGYHADDREFIAGLGGASGYVAVLVLALYLNSVDVTRAYSRPAVLWLICPLFLYWISRQWLITHRGQMDDDPVVFAIKDPVSYVVGVLIATCLVVAV